MFCQLYKTRAGKTTQIRKWRLDVFQHPLLLICLGGGGLLFWIPKSDRQRTLYFILYKTRAGRIAQIRNDVLMSSNILSSQYGLGPLCWKKTPLTINDSPIVEWDCDLEGDIAKICRRCNHHRSDNDVFQHPLLSISLSSCCASIVVCCKGNIEMKKECTCIYTNYRVRCVALVWIEISHKSCKVYSAANTGTMDDGTSTAFCTCTIDCTDLRNLIRVVSYSSNFLDIFLKLAVRGIKQHCSGSYFLGSNIL